MVRTPKELITLVKNGDFVDAAVLNAVFRELDNNSRYLRDLIASALLGESLFARDVTVDAATTVGMAVYYDAPTAKWRGGLAWSEVVDGSVRAAAQAQVWGVIYHKSNSTRATLLLLGAAELDLSDAVEGDIVPGQYYLSGTAPGKITRTAPPVGIPVLQVAGLGAAAGTWKVFVKVSFVDFFHSHQHHRFDLVARPAGIATLTDGTWTIDDPDTDLEGWLPADHAIFNGTAPADALFGYHLIQSAFGSMWPPLPIAGVTLQWYRGSISGDAGLTVVPDSLVRINNAGIWWLSNCENEVPWPEDYDGPTTTTTTDDPQCPRQQAMQLVLYFTQMAFQTDNSVVSSLTVASGSEDLLSITCREDGSPASSGNLQLAFNLDLLVDSTIDRGAFALKSLTARTFSRGPVVSRVRAGSSNVIISGTASDGTYSHGDLTVSVVDNSIVTSGNALVIDTVRLDGVEEENYDDILALMFPPNKTTAFRGRILVPPLSGIATVGIVWRGWWMGRVTGAFPELQLSYRVISRPNPPATPIAVPTSSSEQTVAIDGTAVLIGAANRYFELDSSPMLAKPGDIILFTLERPGVGGDAYPGEIHLIKQSGVIVSATEEE